VKEFYLKKRVELIMHFNNKRIEFITSAQKKVEHNASNSKLKEKTPFRVLELGAGMHAEGVIEKALQSEQRKLKREFTAVDIALNPEEALRRRGLSKLPSNLKLIRNCAVDELKKTPAASQDIIFESFLINIIGSSDRAKARTYLEEAKRVLKPNGLMVIIQGPAMVQQVWQMANDFGFKGYARILTEKEMKSSFSEYIQSRSTLERRRADFLEHARAFPWYLKRGMEDAKELGISELSDLHRPVVLVLRK
jgi:ubiquinone/menaquinone biosynthesis C-methylase UbiE